MSRNRTYVLITMVSLLGACASMKYGDKETEAKLKQLQPVSDMVSLYVCRESAILFGAGVNTVAFVDNLPIGTLKPNTFAHSVLSPGKHEVFLRKDGLATGSSGVLSIEAKAGDVVFVWAGMTGGGFGTLTVDHFNDKKEAEQCVKGAQYSVRAE